MTKQKNSGGNSGRKLVPQKHGGALLPGGVPGNKGGTGRPPDEFKGRMAAIASLEAGLEFLEKCVVGEHGPQFAIAAHRYVADRGYGRVSNVVEGSPDAPTAPTAIRITYLVVRPS